MKKKTIRAVEMVRTIRDAQARCLEGRTDDEIIEFFRLAGAAARAKAVRAPETQRRPQKRRLTSE